MYINNGYLCRFEIKSFYYFYWQLHLNVFTWVLNLSPGSDLSSNFSGHILTFQTNCANASWLTSTMKQIRVSHLYMIREYALGILYTRQQDIKSAPHPEVKPIMSGTWLTPLKIHPTLKFPSPNLHIIHDIVDGFQEAINSNNISGFKLVLNQLVLVGNTCMMFD